MKKYRIGIALPNSDGMVNTGAAGFVSQSITQQFKDPDLVNLIDEIVVLNCQRFPTDTTRNAIVKTAQEAKVDICFMIDSDAKPCHGFFKTAINFLIAHPGSVIGCPYLSGDYKTQVFRCQSIALQDPLNPQWSTQRYPTEEAVYRHGVEQIANIGTHTIAYCMKAFDNLEHPYYAYTYDSKHLNAIETEECFAHRRMVEVGVKFYVAWDHWSGHVKQVTLMPLDPIHPSQIPDYWKKAAKDYYLYSDEGVAELQRQLRIIEDRSINN